MAMTSRQAHGPKSRALLFSIIPTSLVSGLFRRGTGHFSCVSVTSLDRQHLFTEARGQVSLG